MKLGGRTDLSTTETIELIPQKGDTPALKVTLTSLPLGFQDKLKEEIPEPVPPETPAIDPKTGQEVIIPGTNPPRIKMVPNTEDPDYKKKEALHNRQSMGYYIYHGTKDDPNIEWDTDPESMNKAQFYEEIHRELTESRLGFGHMLTLQQKIMEISGCSMDQLRRVRKAFLASEEFAAVSEL